MIKILGILFLLGFTSNAWSLGSIYDIKVNTIDGKETTLEAYKGKVLLIVNTASRCGFTKQYQGLEELYTQYRAKGFEVLAFPANNFMGQEPGTNEEIKSFCLLKFKTEFPLFAKISVKGKDMHPLYQFLTSQQNTQGDITWNFNKFLVDQQGNVVARFDSKVDPLDSQITAQVDQILSKQ